MFNGEFKPIIIKNDPDGGVVVAIDANGGRSILFVYPPVDEEAYGFLRIDYEGTYYTSLLEKKDVKFKNETEQSIESYRVSMVTDLPSKRPCIYRVFKFKFLRTGEIRFEVSVKKRNFNFTIYTID